MENLILIIGVLILLGLVIDGLTTGSVWVKGCKNKVFDAMVHKRSRTEEPVHYWFFILAYGFSAFFIIVWAVRDASF